MCAVLFLSLLRPYWQKILGQPISTGLSNILVGMSEIKLTMIFFYLYNLQEQFSLNFQQETKGLIIFSMSHLFHVKNVKNQKERTRGNLALYELHTYPYIAIIELAQSNIL